MDSNKKKREEFANIILNILLIPLHILNGPVFVLLLFIVIVVYKIKHKLNFNVTIYHFVQSSSVTT